MGPRLLGIFRGGRFEEYIPSRRLTNDEYCKPWSVLHHVLVWYFLWNGHFLERYFTRTQLCSSNFSLSEEYLALNKQGNFDYIFNYSNYYICFGIAGEVGRILARIHSLDMPISKTYRLTQFTDDLIESLKSSSRWTKSYQMHSTLAKFDKELVSCESYNCYYRLTFALFFISSNIFMNFSFSLLQCPDLITIDLLKKELEICKKCLARSGSPLIFSNNDLHVCHLPRYKAIKFYLNFRLVIFNPCAKLFTSTEMTWNIEYTFTW